MAALCASDAIERGAAAYGWRDILMEQLGISREEYRVFSDGSLKLQGLYGYPALTDATALAMLQVISLQDFSCRTGAVSWYADLYTIVTTRCRESELGADSAAAAAQHSVLGVSDAQERCERPDRGRSIQGGGAGRA